jgi:hypothetical protein
MSGMVAYLFLVGKEFSLPEDVSVGIIGLFFGLIGGLFYYQHYYKPYFWGISLAGGLILTIEFHSFFQKRYGTNDVSNIWLTIAAFGIPFILTMALNQGLYYIKETKRKKRSKQRRPARFFDMVNPDDPSQSAKAEKDLAA